jgi:hypothetical protein
MHVDPTFGGAQHAFSSSNKINKNNKNKNINNVAPFDWPLYIG